MEFLERLFFVPDKDLHEHATNSSFRVYAT